MSRAGAGTLAVVAIALAYVWPMQGPNGVQNAHYALARALASGTTRIDKSRFEIGQASTNDISRYHGHIYSNKAPGLALLAAPLFKLLDAAGTGSNPQRALWALGLLVSVLPAIGLVLLVRAAGDRLAPGYGIVSALAIGLGTLVLPYATIFLSHALSAFLVFAAFMLLWRPLVQMRAIAFAGVLAGYAVTTEYPNAIAVVMLGIYLLTRARALRPLLIYASGVAIGILPLLAYDWVSFGSPFRLSYLVTELPVPPQFHFPSLRIALQILLGFPGLVPLAPVIAAGAAGLILAWRNGYTRESALAVVLTLAYVGYNSAFYSPFGGYSPGPRYLITIVPFLVFALPLVARELPLTTMATVLVSALIMALITATYALAGYDGRWLHRLVHGQVPQTAASVLGVTGAIAIAPFFAAVAVAIGMGAYAVGNWSRARAPDVLLAGGALCCWAVLAATAPSGADAGRLLPYTPGLLAIAAAVGAATYALRR